MILINEDMLKLKSSYLFSEIAGRVAQFEEEHPDHKIIRLGIGDVTEPLPAACRDALHAAVDEMGARRTFKGYGPEQGYAFLREAIAEAEFDPVGAGISPDEIFISDGSKCDTANIEDIFAAGIQVAIPDPVYTVYLESNVMAGRTGPFCNGRFEGLVYLESNLDNGYIPDLPDVTVDLIYLCFPNNPTGATATRDQLAQWVNFARENRAIILFDAAYEAYVRDPDVPRSIYEIDGAKEAAIEFRSFSKNAGFTGIRCAYTVIPRELKGYATIGNSHSVHALWERRQASKFNGVSYPIQCAAAAVYTEAGRAQVRALTDFYLGNARIIRETIEDLGYHCCGGDNSPYLWICTNRDSWEFFDLLLSEAGVVCTPGAGFGPCGEGHIRISAFNSREQVVEAMRRLKGTLGRNG